MNHRLRLLLALGLATLLPAVVTDRADGAPGAATASLVDADDDKAPLKVTSDRMLSDRAKGIIEFTGSVDAVKGSLRLVADKILVFADESGNDFTRIKALGSVRITKGSKRATGDQAEYFREEKTIILTGSPTLDDGKSVATGEKVIYNFLTEEMTLLGGNGADGQSGRATVTLFANDRNEIVTGADAHTPVTTPTPTPRFRDPAYTVQVAAFREEADARAFAAALRAKGYDPRLLTDQSGGRTVHRVRVGRFATKEEARALQARLLADEKIEGFTLRCENGCD